MSAIRKLTVVVPCYNEEANIPRFSVELFDSISRLVPETEFLFVDDGSTDSTAQLLDAVCRARKGARLLRHEGNKGLGMSLRTGFAAATGDAILTLDADLTFHPGEFPKLLQAYSDDVAAVLGSPLLGRMEHVPAIRRLLSHGVNIAYRALLGQALTSTSSVFRLYQARALKELDLTSRSFDINAEIVFKLVQKGKQMREVPVILLTRTGGVSKISTVREIRNHLKLLSRIFLWRLGFAG